MATNMNDLIRRAAGLLPALQTEEPKPVRSNAGSGTGSVNLPRVIDMNKLLRDAARGKRR